MARGTHPRPDHRARRRLVGAVVVLVVVAGAVVGVAVVVSSSGRPQVARVPTSPTAPTALQRWLARPVVRIAHRGGDADWPETSPLAYADAAAWNPSLALEFPARRTADGVWVASEDATTGRVYGTDLTIATTTWSRLSTLRSTVGGQPMSRLQQTVLDRLPRDRVLFVDDKDDADVGDLLDLLDAYGGAGRTVIKSYGGSSQTPVAAHARGYTTWGYFYESDTDRFAAAQQRFDLLGLPYDAPAAVWRTAVATGKRVLAFVVATAAEADQGLAAGATGLMVSGVREVVPPQS